MNANIFTQNKTIMNAIANAASLEELQEIFAKEGLDVSLDELRSAVEMLANGPQDGELNDAQLDNVAGGIAVSTCYIILNGCLIAMTGKPVWLLLSMIR